MKKLKCPIVDLIMVASLFLVGLFTTPLMLSFTETVLGRSIVFGSIKQSANMRISFAALLAICSISARVLPWVYSKFHVISSGLSIYFLGLVISLVSIFAAILLNLVRLKSILSSGLDLPLHSELIHYFSWGIEGLVIIYGAIILLLLLVATKRKKQATTAV